MNKTIIIPSYNEKQTIDLVIKKVKDNISLDDNIVIADDGSTDGTVDKIKLYEKDSQIECILSQKNEGKGSAIINALNNSKKLNDIILIQDADLEYDPEDYKKLFLPFYETNADVVYGSRFLGGAKYYRIHFFLAFHSK